MRCRMFFSFPGKVSADTVKTARWEIAQFLQEHLPDEYKKRFVFSVYFPFEREGGKLVLQKPFQLTFSSSDSGVVIAISNLLSESKLTIGGQEVKKERSFLLPAREYFPDIVVYETIGPLLLKEREKREKYIALEECIKKWEEENKRYEVMIGKNDEAVKGALFFYIKNLSPNVNDVAIPQYRVFRTIRILHGDASSSKPADITYPGLVVTFVLSAPPEVHKRLYEEGIGEMREEGFGMLEVVG
ncbi:MAG: hypothetical protein HPY78_05775 [Brevinematales bacterium]|nr:hypothetical protein [Brevinematales bacterium]